MAETTLGTVTTVECMLGEVRAGHGMKLAITLPGFAGAESVMDVKLDLCGDVYAAMPPGTATAANWLLPLKVRGTFVPDHEGARRGQRGLVNPQDASGNVSGPSGPESVASLRYSFVLGARKLSHGTLRQRLADLQTSGDPPFAMDLLCTYQQQPRLLCRVATRASSLLTALDSSSHDLQLLDPIPPSLLSQARARRRPSTTRVAMLLLRWWLLPLLFTAFCAGLLLASAEVAHAGSLILPRVIRLPCPGRVRSVAAALPPVPESLSQAFRLGTLGAIYFASSPRDATLLAQAAALLAREQPLSEEELGGVLGHLQQLEQHVGLITRVRGFFAFVNTMWLVAIVGIAVSIGPSLYVLLRPLRDWLKRCAKWLFRHVVKPLVRFLHEHSFLEAGAWLLCGGIVLEAHQHFAEEVALYIATTGIALACPALAYSTFRHAGKFKGGDPRAVHRMVSTWLAVTTALLAMAHDSTLLGYVSVVAFYAAIGFQVAAYGLCIAIGFDSDSAMERCAMTSFVLLSGMGGARFLNNSLTLGVHLDPFRSAVHVLGCIVLFLALLIMSSRFYHGGRRRVAGSALIRARLRLDPHLFVNAATLCMLLSFMAIGSLGGLPGMANTSTVFLVLWLVEKYADFHVEKDWSGWVLMLVLSVVAWRWALWLHSRPAFIASLLEF